MKDRDLGGSFVFGILLAKMTTRPVPWVKATTCGLVLPLQRMEGWEPHLSSSSKHTCSKKSPRDLSLWLR